MIKDPEEAIDESVDSLMRLVDATPKEGILEELSQEEILKKYYKLLTVVCIACTAIKLARSLQGDYTKVTICEGHKWRLVQDGPDREWYARCNECEAVRYDKELIDNLVTSQEY